MHIQLLISLLFHLFHFGKYDRLSCYIDRLAVMVVTSVPMLILALTLDSYLLAITAIAMPIVYIFDPSANIRASSIQAVIGLLVSGYDTIYNPERGLWWMCHTLSSIAVSLFYILEIYVPFPFSNKWIGWHDIFHSLINLVYYSRLTTIPTLT
jgi:hypothetical protein